MASTASAVIMKPSGQNAIEIASRHNSQLFAVYIGALVVTALVLALFTYLTWRSGNAVQDAIVADANARIAEAGEKASLADKAAGEANKRAGELENGNLELRGQVATLEKQASDAHSAQQEVEIELAKQQQRAAKAEKSLLSLRMSLKDRTISPEQEKILVAALTNKPTEHVEIWWTASDTDSFGLATQMVSAFKNAGWPDTLERFAAGGTGNGFFIAVRDHTHASSSAVAIQQAFSEIGIAMQGFSRPDVPPNQVWIYIGHKVPASP